MDQNPVPSDLSVEATTPVVGVTPITATVAQPVVVPAAAPTTTITSPIATPAPAQPTVAAPVETAQKPTAAMPAYMDPDKVMATKTAVQMGNAVLPKEKTDNGDGVNKKMGKAGTAVVAIASMLILGTGLGVGVKLALTSQEARKSQAAEANLPTEIVDTSDKSGEFVDEPVGLADEMIVPWEGSELMKSPEPQLPTVSELEVVYKKVRSAIEARNWSAFQEVGSRERVWNLQNLREFVGQTKSGTLVFRRTDAGETNSFMNDGPFLLNYLAPSGDSVEYLSVKWDKSTEGREVVMMNKDNRSGEKYKLTPWKYLVIMSAAPSEDFLYSGSGKIYFVYDQSGWKYQGEVWETFPNSKNMDTYLRAMKNKQATKVQVGPTGKCTPIEVSVSSGGEVKWDGVVGMIRSIDSPAGGAWNSWTLKGEPFVQKFLKTGKYKYVIQNMTQEKPVGECVVNVN